MMLSFRSVSAAAWRVDGREEKPPIGKVPALAAHPAEG